METSESAVHGTRVYFAGVGPKGPALERFPDIKYIYNREGKKRRYVSIKYIYNREGKKRRYVSRKVIYNFPAYITSLFPLSVNVTTCIQKLQ
jgi:hypothetical protein